jgi:hypothetical protein
MIGREPKEGSLRSVTKYAFTNIFYGVGLNRKLVRRGRGDIIYLYQSQDIHYV